MTTLAGSCAGQRDHAKPTTWPNRRPQSSPRQSPSVKSTPPASDCPIWNMCAQRLIDTMPRLYTVGAPILTMRKIEDTMSDFRLVGVLRLPPLPGAANYICHCVHEIAGGAAEDACALHAAGFTDVIIQDASDNPQPEKVGPATVAAISAIGAHVRRATDISIGIVPPGATGRRTQTDAPAWW